MYQRESEMFSDSRFSNRSEKLKGRVSQYSNSVRDGANLGNTSGNHSYLADSSPYSFVNRTTPGRTSRDSPYLVDGMPSQEAHRERTLTSFDEGMNIRKREITKHVHQFHQQTSGDKFIDYEHISRLTEMDNDVYGFQKPDKNYAHSSDLNHKNNREQVSPSDIPGSSRFSSMTKYSPEIDNFLAASVTEMFRKGIEQEQYRSMICEENNPRPSNCEGLKVIRVNDEVWRGLSPLAKTNDQKMQSIATAVINAAVVLTNLANSTAKLQKHCPEVVILVDRFVDSLALLGHANYLLNMTRRDFLKPELGSQNAHLCRHTLPLTDFLFEDGMLYEPFNKISVENAKNNGNRMMRGGPKLRGRGSRGNVHTRSYKENSSTYPGYPYPKRSPTKFRREHFSDRTEEDNYH